MKRKKQKRILHPIHIKIITITVGVLSAAGLYYWYSASQSIQPSRIVNASLPDREDVLMAKGKVTMIRNSCGARFLNPSEVKDPMRYAVCDTGTGIRIEDDEGNEVYISTSAGGPGSPYGGHRRDINPGDIVTVYYV